MRAFELHAEISALEGLSSGSLRDCWLKTTRKPLPKVSPALLRLALAWEIQAQALGGLSSKTQMRLDQIAAGQKHLRKSRPSVRLSREWNGAVHTVTVNHDGSVEWQEKEWRSLNEVARAITGTREPGAAFFQLEEKLAA